jgi:hypothetical protein
VHLEFTDGRSVIVTSGQAGGLMNAVNSAYPSAAAGLDAVAKSLADRVNAYHDGGQGLGGVITGPFFGGTDAKSLSVAITDPR